ncbi:hypothetical protein BDF20DRAFT_884406 [Mycotypha africana]|uniref:uncharacterized protein n=1 Tax=Mycotypha africana TaxID=64632 RepID=UPI00230064DD|nr:uncharacterized protein BDF20DRAFT_884406 [Mycotypha africana]KAI8971415.1 hypothetical protein BDF20DRAFT_884406 [Mycotypha africana]
MILSRRSTTIQFLFLLVFLTFSYNVRAEYVRRGVARVMDFNEYSAFNVTEGSELGKRDRVTWYNGQDLKKAACFTGRNGAPRVDAHVHDMIGAMAMHGFEQCNKCMRITNNRAKSKKVVVQIIDKCAACKVGSAIDLTPGAFKKLAPGGDLGLGVLDITFKPVKCPTGGIFSKLAHLL